MTTEREAIDQLRRGDIRGLEVLVREYQVRAAQTAYLIVRDWGAAEDIVQNTFLQVYERIQQFDAHRPFGPWFMRLILNNALMSARRERRQLSLETGNQGESFEEVLAAPDLTADAETREVVWQALGELSAEQRAAIIQRYFLEMSEAEMGQSLASPPGTIKWRLHAARKRLRALLKPFRLMHEGIK